MSNKICLITGATSGIGKATATELAKLGFDLILTGRSATKGQELSDSLAKRFQIKSEFIKCDISSLNAVRSLSEKVKSSYNHLDVLINNAGSRFNDHKKSTDGIELTFATNHLGHFLLTHLLMDLLIKSPAARIINISSSAHGGNKIEIDDLVNPKIYDGSKAYGRSKLANILFTYELSRALKSSRITVNALHPGGVASNFTKNNGLIPWAKHLVYYLLKRKLLTPKQGAKTVVYLASSTEVEGVTGKYFYRKKEVKSSSDSYEMNTAKQLWVLSSKLCGLEEKSL